MSLIEITLKLLLAVALGGLVGLERESSHKPAGFRTNILICVGSTMMMILSGLVLGASGTSTIDLTRIAAGVITGIGFMGAGTIIRARGSIVGLTTAATLWAMAGLGLVIGAGYYLAAVIFTAIVISTLVVFRYFEEHFLKKIPYFYHLKLKYTKDILAHVRKLALHEGVRLDDLALRKEGNFAILDLAFHTSGEKEQKFNLGLIDLAEVIEIKIEY
ncbi:MAG: MgtC/SapB family protein [Candidatus Aminicenantes bacterium]|nr:MgtC/SapB family protein [Candidatus Aminicenantes bacterium]